MLTSHITTPLFQVEIKTAVQYQVILNKTPKCKIVNSPQKMEGTKYFVIMTCTKVLSVNLLRVKANQCSLKARRSLENQV